MASGMPTTRTPLAYLCRCPGVRPSSGEATSASSGGSELPSARSRLKAAAPEDGRTPTAGPAALNGMGDDGMLHSLNLSQYVRRAQREAEQEKQRRQEKTQQGKHE